MVLLCDGRLVCGCADPVRQARPRRYQAGDRVARSGPARAPRRCASDLNSGGSKFCGDCPLKLPLKKDASAAAARRSTSARCRRGSTSSARRPVTSRAPRPAARPKPASPAPARRACWTSTSFAASSTRPARRSAASISSTTAKRSSTSARSRCASTSSARFPHVYLYTSTNGLAFNEEQVRRLVRSGHRRGHVLDRRRNGGELRDLPQARRFRQGDPQPAIRGRREARNRLRPAVPELALHPVHPQRQRCGDGAGAGDGSRHWRRSPVLGADRSSRGHVLAPLHARARPSTPPSSARSGTTTTSATPFPAPCLAREIEVRQSGALPGDHRSASRTRSVP